MVAIEGLDRLTLVGQGGFATVYSAYEPSLDRIVAVKVLSTSAAVDTARFLREVQLMGNLSGHPNIAPVFRSGVTDDGRAYLVMPYFEEGSLNDLVLTRGPLETREVLRVGVKLCGALQTVHETGIVHGDVKPHNVLFTSYHEPVLTDFGVALELGATSTNPLPAFSPGFVAPEIIGGEPMTTASDVFSLALTIAAAAGHRPWSPGEPIARILERRLGREELGEAVDPDLKGVLTPALDPLPAARPTARELGESLVELQLRRGEPPTHMLVPAARHRPSDDSPPPSAWPPPAAPLLTTTPSHPAVAASARVAAPPPPSVPSFDTMWPPTAAPVDPSVTITGGSITGPPFPKAARRSPFGAIVAAPFVLLGVFVSALARGARTAFGAIRRAGRGSRTDAVAATPQQPSTTMSALLADRPSPVVCSMSRPWSRH